MGMSKWLEAARKKIGGKFPKHEVKEQMLKYVDRMKKRKSMSLVDTNVKVTKRTHRPIIIDYDDQHEIELDDVCQALAIRWVRAARKSAEHRFRERGVFLRHQILDILKQISPKDDWFFGAQTRKEGQILMKEGEQVMLDSNIRQTNVAVKINRIRSEIDAFRDQVEDKLKKKQDILEKNITEANEKVKIEIELRARELHRLADLTRRKHQEE